MDQYRDLAEGRSKVLHLFEKSGYNPDCCDMHASPLILLACTRLWPACSMLCPGHFCQEVPLHQRADPGGETLEVEGEFLTEEDMRAKNWTEPLASQ